MLIIANVTRTLFSHVILVPISGQVDRACATDTVYFRSIPCHVKVKTKKNWYSQFSCLTFSIERDRVKPPPCVVDRWAGGSLTRKPKCPFAGSWQRQLGE